MKLIIYHEPMDKVLEEIESPQFIPRKGDILSDWCHMEVNKLQISYSENTIIAFIG